MPLFRELGSYVWAVISNWAGYVTGGIIVAAIWLWSSLSQKSLPRRFSIVLALFFLVVANFNAWRDQYQKASSLQTELDAYTLPLLQGRIDAVFLAPGGKGGSGTLMTAIVSITNKGAPSIVRGFRVNCLPGGGKPILGQPVASLGPGAKLKLGMEGSPQSFSFDGSDSIQRAAITQPVAKGGEVRGFLQEFFPDIQRNSLRNCQLQLRFSDVNEKSYTVVSSEATTVVPPLDPWTLQSQ